MSQTGISLSTFRRTENLLPSNTKRSAIYPHGSCVLPEEHDNRKPKRRFFADICVPPCRLCAPVNRSCVRGKSCNYVCILFFVQHWRSIIFTRIAAFCSARNRTYPERPSAVNRVVPNVSCARVRKTIAGKHFYQYKGNKAKTNVDDVACVSSPVLSQFMFCSRYTSALDRMMAEWGGRDVKLHVYG